VKITEEMVTRFLSWPLPKSVCSDLCVTNRDYKFPRFGTSLLTADEARTMLEHVFGEAEATHALQRIQQCVREVQQICDYYNLDPVQWLQDNVAQEPDSSASADKHDGNT